MAKKKPIDLGSLLPFGKPHAYRSPEYREFLRQFGCIVKVGCFGDIVFHHIETGGVGMKGSDLIGCPLCVKHHNYGGQHGWKTFERVFNTVMWKEAFACLRLYVVHLETTTRDGE